MGILLGAALASLLAADTGCALPAPDSVPWPRSETLTYEVGAARLPGSASADLEATTVNGSIDSDFPITMRGRMTPQSLRGRIGDGGRDLKLTTVNGGITIRKAS